MSAAEIIAALGMKRHPEGGWYAETFRDGPGRGHSTAIYFLLEKGDISAWHRVKDAAEVWHFYAGAAIELTVHEESGGISSHRLGPDILAGERPQHVAGRLVANGEKRRRVDTGRLHSRARLRIRSV